MICLEEIIPRRKIFKTVFVCATVSVHYYTFQKFGTVPNLLGEPVFEIKYNPGVNPVDIAFSFLACRKKEVFCIRRDEGQSGFFAEIDRFLSFICSVFVEGIELGFEILGDHMPLDFKRRGQLAAFDAEFLR